jgi:SAM-dependent methyltransferase
MYHLLWADWYLPAAMPALESLFFSQVPAGARVLDLCCGSGHVTKELVRRGYAVTGVDSSAELIDIASKDLPEVDLCVQDVRNLQLDERFAATLSTFDSLNHILTLEDLERVFSRVYQHLEKDGRFVFDMNLEQAYSADLHEWSVDISEQAVSLVRGTYDTAKKQALTELVWFVREGTENLWRQRRSTVEQRCYTQNEITAALECAGFTRIEAIPAKETGVKAELGFGRIFFVTRRYE